MAKSKIDDITKTGGQTYRDLQKQNAADYEIAQTSSLAGLTPDAPILRPRDFIYEGPEQSPLMRQTGGEDYWGNSMFDDQNISEEGLQDITSIRADNQPWYAKIAAGISKGAILAGTTFLDGTVGLLTGLGTAISEGRWSGIWDNSFSRAMKDVNDWSEKALPNYYTKEELERPWYENIFTANFLGDKFIKNLGFSVGAFYSGNIYAAPFRMGKVAQAINSVFSSTKAAPLTSALVGSGLAAINEGRVEAINNSTDWFNLKKQELDDWYNKQIADEFAPLYEEAQKEFAATKGNIQQVQMFDGSTKVIDPAAERYKHRLAQLDAQMADKIALKDSDKRYQEAIGRLSEDRLKMGNMDLLMNLPVLMASNLIQFGKAFAGGYKTGRVVDGVKRRSFNTAEKNATKGAVAEGAATKEVGTTAAAETGAKVAATEATEAAVKPRVNWMYEYAQSKFATPGAIIKSGFSEGTEEITQKAASVVAGKYYETDINNWYRKQIDPDAEEETLDFIKANVEGIAETFGDISSWEEFFIGGLTGMLGIPTVTTRTNTEGKSRLGFKIQGGAYNTWRDVQEKRARGEELAAQMNARIQSPEFLNYYQGLIRHNALQRDMDDALKSGNPFDFKNAEHAQFVSDIIMFDKAGRLNDLEAILETTLDTSEENLAEIVKKTTSKTADGKLAGPYAEYAHLEDDNSISVDFGREGVAEMTKKVNKQKKESLAAIKSYKKVKTDLDITYGAALDDEQLAELTYMQTQLQDWQDRAKDMAPLIRKTFQSMIDNVTTLRQQADKRVEESRKKTTEPIDKSLDDELVEAVADYKRVDREKKYLDNIRDLLSKSDEEIVQILMNPENKEYLEAVLENVKMFADDYISGLDVFDAVQMIGDLAKIGEGIKNYQSKLKEYLVDPNKITEDKAKVTEEVAKEIDEKKATNLKDRLSKAKNVAELRDIIKGETETGGIDAAIEELEKEGSTVAKNYRETQMYDNEVQKALNELGEDAQTTQDAKALWEEQKNAADNIEQIANPNSVFINNETAFDEDSGGDVEASAVRFQNARYTIQKAMSKVNNDIKFRDRFSPEYKQTPTKNEGKSEEPGTTPGGTNAEEGQRGQAPQNIQRPQGATNIPQTPGTSQTPIGNETAQEIIDANKKANEGAQSPADLDKQQQGKRKYYNPTIPELHIEASKEGDFRPFDVVVAEREHGANYHVIYEYLRDNGAFDYVNSGKLKVGDTLRFMIDPEFEESMKASLGDRYKGPTIFFVTAEGQIVGDVASSTAGRYEGLQEAVNKIKEEYSNSQKRVGTYVTNIKEDDELITYTFDTYRSKDNKKLSRTGVLIDKKDLPKSTLDQLTGEDDEVADEIKGIRMYELRIMKGGEHRVGASFFVTFSDGRRIQMEASFKENPISSGLIRIGTDNKVTTAPNIKEGLNTNEPSALEDRISIDSTVEDQGEHTAFGNKKATDLRSIDKRSFKPNENRTNAKVSDNTVNIYQVKGHPNFHGRGGTGIGITAWRNITDKEAQQIIDEIYNNPDKYFTFTKNPRNGSGTTANYQKIADLVDEVLHTPEHEATTQTQSPQQISNGKFISSLETRVSQMMVGKVPYTSEERNLADIPGVSDENRQPIFGIAKQGIIHTNGKVTQDKIITPADLANKDGRLYLLIPNAAGTYSPVAVRVKHLNRQEFNLEDPTVAETLIGKEINQLISKLSQATTKEEVSSAMEALAKEVFMGDIIVSHFDKAGGGILFSRKIRKPDGTYEMTTIDGQEVPKTVKTPIYFYNAPTSVTINGIHYTSLEAAKDAGADITPYMERKSDEEVQKAIITLLMSYNLPLQVDVNTINSTGQNTRLIKSGILTSNLREAKVIGSWFTTDYFDAEGNLKEASRIPNVPRKASTSRSPVGGAPSIIPGIKISGVNHPTRYINLTTNTILDENGKDITSTMPADEKQLYFDMAWALNAFGNATVSSSMIDNKVVTPEGRVLNRTTGKYLTGEAAQKVKDDIANRNKRVADSEQVLQEIQANQVKVDKGRTDSEYYYIQEEDGEYHPYSRVHSVLGDNWTGSREGTNSSNALKAGSMVDTIIRDFFNDKTPTRPEEMSEEAFNSLLDRLNDIKANIEARGEKFLTNNIVLYQKYADGTRVAGEVDILAVDRNGNFKIYDVKTSKYSFGGTYFNTKGDKQRMSTKDYYTLQLSAYQDLFESQYRVPVISLGILPFVLTYDGANISKITGEKGISITYNSNSGVHNTYRTPEVKPAGKTTALAILEEMEHTTDYKEGKVDDQIMFPEELGNNTIEDFYEVDGKLHKGYVTNEIGEVDGIPIGVAKIPQYTKGFKKDGEEHIAFSDYYAVFPNGKTFKILQSDSLTDKEVADTIVEVLSKNPTRVKSIASEESIITKARQQAEESAIPTTPAAPNAPIAPSNSGAAAAINITERVTEKDDEFEDDANIDGLLKKAEEGELEIWDQGKEVKWLEKHLPQLSKEDRLQIVKGLINVADKGPIAWGMFSKGIITLSDIAAKGTLYHEAFHAVFNLMLSRDERLALYDEARKLYGENLSLRDLQEEMAEGFRNYMLDQDSRGLGRKIRDFFKNLWIKARFWKKTKPTLDSYYRAINNGRYRKNAINDRYNDDTMYSRSETLQKYESEMDSIKQQAIKNGTFMKAPNGNPTNLNERQWLQVRTKAFKSWFGDWEKVANITEEELQTASLIFDRVPELAKIGTPSEYAAYIKEIFPNSVEKEVYWHGSNEDFSEGFSSAKRGEGSGALETKKRNDLYLNKQGWASLQYVNGINRKGRDKNGFAHWNKLWWELKEIMSNGRRENNDWKDIVIDESTIRQAIPNKKGVFNRDSGGKSGKWLSERKADYGYENKSDKEFFEEVFGIRLGKDTFNTWTERNAEIFKSLEKSAKGINPVVIDVRNPIVEEGQNTYYEEQRGLFTIADAKGNDAILSKKADNEFNSDVAVVINANNDNVYWLGTKSDIERFRQWKINNNASKVVDENGEPLVVYHTTREVRTPRINIFKKQEGYKSNSLFYFSNSKESSQTYFVGLPTIGDFTSRKELLNEYKEDEEFRDINTLQELENIVINKIELINKEINILNNRISNKGPKILGKVDLNTGQIIKEKSSSENNKIYSLQSDLHYYNNILNTITPYIRVEREGYDNIKEMQTYQVFLNIKTPFIVNAKNMSWDTFDRSLGIRYDFNPENFYFESRKNEDGFIITNFMDASYERDTIISTTYAVENPNQIKSATDNIGQFSRENDDIYYSTLTTQELEQQLDASYANARATVAMLNNRRYMSGAEAMDAFNNSGIDKNLFYRVFKAPNAVGYKIQLLTRNAYKQYKDKMLDRQDEYLDRLEAERPTIDRFDDFDSLDPEVQSDIFNSGMTKEQYNRLSKEEKDWAIHCAGL